VSAHWPYTLWLTNHSCTRPLLINQPGHQILGKDINKTKDLEGGQKFRIQPTIEAIRKYISSERLATQSNTYEFSSVSADQIVTAIGVHEFSEMGSGWKSWLNFCSFGKLALIVSNRKAFRASNACFESANVTEIPLILSKERHEYFVQRRTHNTGRHTVRDWGKRVYKFFLDKIIEEAPVVSIMDDDACFIRELRPGDVLRQGRLVVRGQNLIQARKLKREAAVEWLWPGKLGIGYFGGMDFPYPVWSRMLQEFRLFVIESVIEKMPLALMNRTGIYYGNISADELFVDALYTIPTGIGDEYALLYNFAYNSPAWKDKFHWNLVPMNSHEAAIASTIHNTATWGANRYDCPARGNHFPAEYLLFPRNVGLYYDIRNRTLKSAKFMPCMLGVSAEGCISGTPDDNEAFRLYYDVASRNSTLLESLLEAPTWARDAVVEKIWNRCIYSNF